MHTARALQREGLILRLPALAAALIVALALAGCGGGDAEYREVPGAPAEITLPESSGGSDALSADDAQDSGSDAEATPTPTPGADAEGAQGATGTPTPAPAAQDSPETDQPPAPGSDAQRFEDFCEQNAGAC